MSEAVNAAACVVVLLSTPAARGSDATDAQAARTAVIQRLIGKGTADSLGTAAVLKQFGQESDTGAYSLAAQAVALAPDRADLAWLAVRLCDAVADCDSAVAERHLREVDPTNAAGYLGELSRALQRNDAAGVDAALSSIGQSRNFDVYFNPLVVFTTEQLAIARRSGGDQPSRKEERDAQLQMLGFMAGFALPPLQPISLACRGMELKIEGRLDKCRQAAAVVARGDTFITEGLGLSLQARLWPEDSPEGRDVAAKRLVFQYRLEQYSGQTFPRWGQMDPLIATVELRRTHEREQDTALEYLRRKKIPTEPPPGWRSSQLPRVP